VQTNLIEIAHAGYVIFSRYSYHCSSVWYYNWW